MASLHPPPPVSLLQLFFNNRLSPFMVAVYNTVDFISFMLINPWG